MLHSSDVYIVLLSDAVTTFRFPTTIPSLVRVGVRLTPFSLRVPRELSGLQKSIPDKKKGITQAQSELKVVGEGWERLSQQVRQCRSQLEEARSGLQAHRSQGRVLGALVEQKNSGAIPGIHGRLVRGREGEEAIEGWIDSAC